MALYVIAGMIAVAGWSAAVSVWYGWDQYTRQIQTDALLRSHATLVTAFRSKHHVLPTQSQWSSATLAWAVTSSTLAGGSIGGHGHIWVHG